MIFFLKSFEKGSKPFRRPLQYNEINRSTVSNISTVKTFFNLINTDPPEEKILKFLWSDWNCGFLSNRCREFLYKFRNNILGLNSRVCKFVVTVQAECTFCCLNKEPFPIIAESFIHLFFNCHVSDKYKKKVESALFPEIVNNTDIVRREFWFLGKMPGPRNYNPFISAMVNVVNHLVWEMKLRKELQPLSVFYEDVKFAAYKLLKCKYLREAKQSDIFLCAGTHSILPEMAGNAADDSVALNTSRDSDGASGTDDERLERRMRRAVLDPTYIDGSFSDDEPSRVLRSGSRRKEVEQGPTAMETEAATPAVEADTGGSGGSVAGGEVVTAASPAENSMEKPTEKPSEKPVITLPVNSIVKKVEINFLKAGTPVNPSGAGPSTDTLPNPSGGNGGPSKPHGGGTLNGHSEEENGAYRAVKALGRSCMYNHRLGVVGGSGGPEIAGSLAGSFSDGDKGGRIGLCHVQSVLGKKQNMSLSFDPCVSELQKRSGEG